MEEELRIIKNSTRNSEEYLLNDKMIYALEKIMPKHQHFRKKIWVKMISIVCNKIKYYYLLYSSANGVYCGVKQLPNSSAETKYNILLEKVVNENLARLGCKIAIIE